MNLKDFFGARIMISLQRISLQIEEDGERERGEGTGRMGAGMPAFIFSKDKQEMSFVIKTLQFVLYYPQLRLSVMLGLYQTPNPLDLKWRWNYWRHKNERLRIRRH
jgi:hypothetical protein